MIKKKRPIPNYTIKKFQNRREREVRWGEGKGSEKQMRDIQRIRNQNSFRLVSHI